MNRREFIKSAALGSALVRSGETLAGAAAPRGNSSWGRIFFEVTDAEGKVWTSTGPGGYGESEYDWPCQASISFDGWHLVQFPLTRGSHVPVRCPSSNEFQWTRDGERGNGKIDFPVKVTGLGFGNFQYALDFLDMKPTRPTLRFKDVTLIGK